MKYPKVAVLLAAYNGMQWIEEQLVSILNQADVEITIYISIDPSTDGTQDWCLKFAADNSNIVVLPEAGKFGGASRNFFRLIRDVDFDNFDFIALADQDDIWHSDKLRRATKGIISHRVNAYSSNVTAFWPDGKVQLLNKAQPQVAWDFLFEAAGPGCTYVFDVNFATCLKQSMLISWRELQDVSLHDWYFYAFARSFGFRWFIDPVPSMDYRQHENNQMGANKGLSSLVSRYKTILDGWWLNQVQLIAFLVGQNDNSFIKTWLKLGRWQLLRLSFSAWRCRRRMRDKVFFFFICWATALLGFRK